MGGSQWTSTGPYQKDLESAFRQAQEQELARDDHGFPGRDIVDLWEDDDWREYILTGGTSSVLDFYDLVDAGSGDDFAMMRPLTEGEVSFPGRGTGRCTILCREGEPAEIGYWGCTAD